jgi:hypothetical protein
MCTDVHGFEGYTFIKQKMDLHRPKTLEPVYKMILKPIGWNIKAIHLWNKSDGLA